ncbi:MAG: DUF420 domain-containing protein [Fuerstiella sp.]
MKSVSQAHIKCERNGLSRTALVVGLFLWVAVFVSLYFMNSRSIEPVESGSSVAQGGTAGAVVIDTTSPESAKTSTVKTDFPTRPLPDFSLQNSEGGKFGLKDLKGKRWVASFVFSRCASTCPLITGAMMQVHDRVKGKADDVMFVTITVDPKFDTPEVFQTYGENFRQGDSSRWKFLTGDQQEIYELIVKNFGLYVAENLGNDRKDGFEVAHTNRVVLVNEDAIPVATFLGTRDEDMVKLRRILTGKSDFPTPGPALKLGEANAGAGGFTFKLVPKTEDDESSSESGKDSTGQGTEEATEDEAKADSDSSEDEDEASAVEDNPEEASTHDETKFKDSVSQAEGMDDAALRNSDYSVRSLERPYILTGAAVLQDDESADSKPQTTESNKSNAETESVVVPSKQTVAEFNEALQSRLPGWAQVLPTVNACMNSIATVLLLCGYTAIRFKKKSLHRGLMISAFLMSVIFLVSYLSYHYALGKYTGEHGCQFEGTGIWASIYPWVLWPHVVLAVFVPVLAIRVFLLAFREDWDRHRRLARITFPIWLYVSVTGVVIYGMLYHWPIA